MIQKERKIPEIKFRKLGCLARIRFIQEIPQKAVPFASKCQEYKPKVFVEYGNRLLSRNEETKVVQYVYNSHLFCKSYSLLLEDTADVQQLKTKELGKQ